MHDLILEIDSILLWVVLAFAILAVVLFFLVKESGVKVEPDIVIDHAEARPRGDKPTKTPRKATRAPVDSAAISKYQSAKLWSCEREIKMLEQLNLIEGSRVEPEPSREPPEIKQEHDYDTKKRGFLD